MNQILVEVLEKIRPDENESKKIDELSQNLIDKVNAIDGVNIEPLIVGSVAKGTNLKGADVDLFIKFDTETNLKENGLNIARKILPEGKELYAQHPYLRGEIDEIGVDLSLIHI